MSLGKKTNLKNVAAVMLGLYLFSEAAIAAPPVTENNCKSRWALTTTNFDFGSFSNLSGTNTISMNTTGARTASAGIDLVTSTTVVYQVTLNNTLSPSCGSFGLTLDWNVPPSDLTGPGTNITISNVRAEYPSGSFNTLPITISPTTLPVTIPFEATITSTGLQAAGTYISGPFSLVSTQSGFNETSLDATATATAIVPLAISETVPMNFGTVAGGSASGTIVLDTSGGRTTSGDGQALASGPGTAAAFQIVGQGGQAYTISYSPGLLDDGGLGTAMTVDTFTDTSSGSLPAGGTENINIGATLHLNPNQAAGTYSTATGGTPYTVTVNYN
jgi:hypothetical protein